MNAVTIAGRVPEYLRGGRRLAKRIARCFVHRACVLGALLDKRRVLIALLAEVLSLRDRASFSLFLLLATHDDAI
jgi:ABC-type thiamine transport system ATPase subunit